MKILIILVALLSLFCPAFTKPALRSSTNNVANTKVHDALMHIEQTAQQLASRCAPFIDIYKTLFGPYDGNLLSAALEPTIRDELVNFEFTLRKFMLLDMSLGLCAKLCRAQSFLSEMNITISDAIPDDGEPGHSPTPCLAAADHLNDALFPLYFMSVLSTADVALRILELMAAEIVAIAPELRALCKPYTFELVCRFSESARIKSVVARGIAANSFALLLTDHLTPLLAQSNTDYRK